MNVSANVKELKPCPFCGGEVDCVYKNHRDLFNLTYQYVCRRCGANIFLNVVHKYKSAEATEQEAIKIWNRRADNGEN